MSKMSGAGRPLRPSRYSNKLSSNFLYEGGSRMKAYSKLLAVGAAVMLTGAAGVALALEAFSERFEEDFSTSKTVQARDLIYDPYQDAARVTWTRKGVRNSCALDQY